jgi:hypothetical protein
MELCIFRVRSFGYAPFYFRKKDDYEKSIVYASGSGDASWHDAVNGVCYGGRAYPHL